MAPDDQLSAYVILRPVAPENVTPEMLTMERIHELEFDPRHVGLTRGFFRARGFEVSEFQGLGFSISGSRERFEQCFESINPQHADTGLRAVTERDTLELTLNQLPDHVRKRIQAVSFSDVDFGPEEFF